MRFTADRDAFAEAVGKAAQGVPARPSQPVHAGMLVHADRLHSDDAGTVILTGSDGDVTFRSVMEPHIVDEGGSAILPGRLLAEVAKYLPAGDVTVTCNENGAEIAARRSKFTLSAEPGEKFPEPPVTAKAFGTCDGEALRDAILKVAPSAASGDMNPALNCVLMELRSDGLWLVASNHSQMAAASVPLQSMFSGFIASDCLVSAFIPPWVTTRFARACEGEVSLGWDDKQVMLSCEGLSVTCRTIQGRFPGRKHWSEIILSGPEPCATIDPAEVSRAVKMTRVASGQGDVDTVTLEFSRDNLEVRYSGNKGSICENLDTDYQGEAVSFLLGSAVLLSGLSGCGEKAMVSLGSRVILESAGFMFLMQPRRDISGGD